jgi:hypothetical protein
MNLLSPCSGKKSKPSLLFNPEDTSSKFLRKVVKFLPGYIAKHPRDSMLQTKLPAVIFNISTEVSDYLFKDSYSKQLVKKRPRSSILFLIPFIHHIFLYCKIREAECP